MNEWKLLKLQGGDVHFHVFLRELNAFPRWAGWEAASCGSCVCGGGLISSASSVCLGSNDIIVPFLWDFCKRSCPELTCLSQFQFLVRRVPGEGADEAISAIQMLFDTISSMFIHRWQQSPLGCYCHGSEALSTARLTATGRAPLDDPRACWLCLALWSRHSPPADSSH